MSKMYGDVPEGNKKLADALVKAELEMDDTISAPYKAQAFFCLAHDWYEMGMEEEGHRLLEKAEEACPGYFKTHLQNHCKENPNLALLTERMFVMLGWSVLNGLKDRIK